MQFKARGTIVLCKCLGDPVLLECANSLCIRKLRWTTKLCASSNHSKTIASHGLVLANYLYMYLLEICQTFFTSINNTILAGYTVVHSICLTLSHFLVSIHPSSLPPCYNEYVILSNRDFPLVTSWSTEAGHQAKPEWTLRAIVVFLDSTCDLNNHVQHKRNKMMFN